MSVGVAAAGGGKNLVISSVDDRRHGERASSLKRAANSIVALFLLVL